jgi:hypothetical protein
MLNQFFRRRSMDVGNAVEFADDVTRATLAARIPEPETLLKLVSAPYDDVGGAQDALTAVSAIPGYKFGYVDEKERRTVTFHVDTSPANALPPRSGIARVETRAPMSR